MNITKEEARKRLDRKVYIDEEDRCRFCQGLGFKRVINDFISCKYCTGSRKNELSRLKPSLVHGWTTEFYP